MVDPSIHSTLSDNQKQRLKHWEDDAKSCGEDPSDALKMVRTEGLTEAAELLLECLPGVGGTAEEIFEITKEIDALRERLVARQ